MPSPFQKSRGLRNRRICETDLALAAMYEHRVPGHCYTLNEIAEVCGVSRERIRQIEAKALKRVRNRPAMMRELLPHLESLHERTATLTVPTPKNAA